MIGFDRYVRRTFLGTLSVLLVVAGTFMIAGRASWSRGIILGGAAGLAGLLLMAKDVRRQGAAIGVNASGPGYGNYALRMSIIAAALVYAATSARIALWATIPAVFAVQVFMTLSELLENRGQGPS